MHDDGRLGTSDVPPFDAMRFILGWFEPRAGLWFGAVLRGNNEPIRIGLESDIQVKAVLHADPGSPLVIEGGATVGHLAILHGCRMGAGTLVGIGTVILIIQLSVACRGIVVARSPVRT